MNCSDNVLLIVYALSKLLHLQQVKLAEQDMHDCIPFFRSDDDKNKKEKLEKEQNPSKFARGKAW